MTTDNAEAGDQLPPSLPDTTQAAASAASSEPVITNQEAVSMAKSDQSATDTPPVTAKEALEVWRDSYVRNTPYAQDTEAWNRIHTGVEIINQALAKVDAVQGEGK